MNRKHKFLYVYGLFVISISSLIIFVTITRNQDALRRTSEIKQSIQQAVLGKTSDSAVPTPSVVPNQTHFNAIVLPPGTKSVQPLAIASPSVANYEIALVSVPGELTQGDNAAFTWQISGSSNTIHMTTIYYGTTKQPGSLSTNVTPGETPYTDVVKDFIRGDYRIPLRFVGNTIFSTPGTYFYRAYALIDGKHYWSDQRSLVVKELPKHEIKIVDRPTTLSAGGNAAFTWDVFGPPATTGFTAIVGGKESKPGAIDTSVDLPRTPYAVMVSDFTSGTYAVPLRFIGNAKVTEPGLYYFRALTFINEKNIWSDEYSFTVQ